MIAFISLVYWILILMIIIAGGFIVFHIIRYSYNKAAKTIMLVIFISVFGTLLFINFALFSSLRLQELITTFTRY